MGKTGENLGCMLTHMMLCDFISDPHRRGVALQPMSTEIVSLLTLLCKKKKKKQADARGYQNLRYNRPPKRIKDCLLGSPTLSLEREWLPEATWENWRAVADKSSPTSPGPGAHRQDTWLHRPKGHPRGRPSPGAPDPASVVGVLFCFLSVCYSRILQIWSFFYFF